MTPHATAQQLTPDRHIGSIALPIRNQKSPVLFVVSVLLGLASALPASADPSLRLNSSAQVDSEGIFLHQVLAAGSTHPLPHLRLADAPPFGRVLLLTRDQVIRLLQPAAPELVALPWSGAQQVRIVRRARPLPEDELKQQLTQFLQREHVRDRGELELRLLRPWIPVMIPDETYSLKVLNVPNAGVTPHFIAQFEISTPRETIGRWQMPVQSRVWREILVARTALKSHDLFDPDQVARERRDVLGLFDSPLDVALPDVSLEMADTVPAGAPIYARSVKLRPVIRRGQVVEAQLRDGPVMISLKVEALENGAPGQFVRVRNTQSKREFRGKVEDERTVLVAL